MDYIAFFRESELEIQRLHARIHETLPGRDKPKGREIWAEACREFHARYGDLAFPGGYRSCLARLKENDPETIEAALVFLEVRPYFFRSGYMRQTLMRRLKHVEMSKTQGERFAAVLEAHRQWREAQQGVPADGSRPAGEPRR